MRVTVSAMPTPQPEGEANVKVNTGLLRAALQEKGMTHHDLAGLLTKKKQVPTTRQTVSKIVAGQHQPRVYRLRAIASVLNLKVKELLAADEEPGETGNDEEGDDRDEAAA